jgi:hypothetical protein
MAIKNTSGTLTASTNTTNNMIPLSGQAQWIYVSVWARTCAFFVDTTASTGTGTDIGLQLATGDTYSFQFQPGQAKYFMQVGTAASPFYVTEVW